MTAGPNRQDFVTATEDGVTAPKHVGAILLQILILFLGQSLVHSLVNNKL